MGSPKRDARPSGSYPVGSGARRRGARMATDVAVVVARHDGEKSRGRMLDLSAGGMHVACERVPAYGEPVRILLLLEPGADWLILPATVRWFTSRGFGVEFAGLDGRQEQALLGYVARRAG